MVTLITEQLRKQSLEEPYCKAFSFNVNVAVGSSPTVSWSACRSTEESSSATHRSSRANLLDNTCGPDTLWHPSHSGESIRRSEVSFTDKTYQSSPPPPPSKRHCRSLSVPEDLSLCRSNWHPSASKVWTPVKRGCQSGGASSSGSGASSLPLCGPTSSFTSSSLHSSSSPTFFSLALSSDSPLPWSFPWDPCDKPKGAYSASFATPSSCSSSPSPLVSHSVLQRRFSLSPVHIQDTSVVPLAPQPSPASALTYGCSSGMEHPALSPSPTSACSTPSSSRRDLHLALPRCHSQPCDMRKPRLKRRHDPDVLPCPRPGLDFSKMTQIGNHENLMCGTGGCIVQVSSQAEQCSACSPAEFVERASIGPLSESEEEDEEDERKRTAKDGGQKIVFERDCTELDLNLIEEN
uniref:protein FAM53C-like n=1 Tax=Scatophagus argus TaxID=75038 RepID=UPI001ED7CE05|nr:protein FAM53C-like [Scatophagus argus]XP_046261852.1 protein FAM53C-like [Scatophagus argus]XP_046261853.1 protein FAM53C-like [Scatophagus argus]XP_046261854.1 protein FAM53C-like [Scatophagus argus]XP_046261855.1 protein FAM53C-like [Scatophagus argus]